MQAEVVKIIYDNTREISLLNADEGDFDVEVCSCGRFSTYNSIQLRRNGFLTRAEAEKCGND